jgi:hypothetical protein
LITGQECRQRSSCEKLPPHLACPGSPQAKAKTPQLTLHVAPDVRVGAFVLVDELDHAQQILLLELLESFGDLLVVELLRALLGGDALLLGPILVGGQGAGLAESLLQCLGRVLENYRVCGFVLGLQEVEVLDDWCRFGLLRRVAIDADFEFTPTLVGADEWRLEEGCQSG